MTKSVEFHLRELQRLVRRSVDRSPTNAGAFWLPIECPGAGWPAYGLDGMEAAEYRLGEAALTADLRFEHLYAHGRAALCKFVVRAIDEPGVDHVQGFVTEHAREPTIETCYFPVEHLRVEGAQDLPGARLIPLLSDELPEELRDAFAPPSPVGSVLAVQVRGTSYDGMERRARLSADHTLRVLRVALQEHPWIHDRQLRFRLDVRFTFGRRLAGWRIADDAAYELGFDERLVELARQQPVWDMPLVPTNNVGRKANLAVRWMERASFAGDPLLALLFLCFALEALLGVKSEKLKGPALAFRQAMLSHLVDGGFVHPSQTLVLYDEIRSAAVHGESVRGVGLDDVHGFEWDVRRALLQYMKYAQTGRYTRRSMLVNSLWTHQDAPKLVEWLRDNGGSAWIKYLDKLPSIGAPDG